MTTTLHTEMQNIRFGIEIETVGLSRERIASAIESTIGGSLRGCEVIAPDGRVWKVVYDGSLGSRGGEIVSPILTYADLEALQSVVRAVRRAGARVDPRCGIHIHIDGSRFDARAITNLVKTVHKQEELIEHALGVSRGRKQNYCRGISPDFLASLENRRPRSLDDLNTAWYGRWTSRPARYNHTRYRGVNLHALWYHGTIEFRWFEATLHAGKVKAYIQFALALAARALTAKSASSKRRSLNEATAKYDFRVFLLRLGLIGNEFKTARTHLLGRLEGSAAWKSGRPAQSEGVGQP